ncbi:sensor histidine kinase [Sphingobacterium faecium]|uniref:sensor histidine kinase n=1 Tax=Sphingobacterium TaxID=28453 RepID=UPI0025FF38FD|nr:7TM diverse intracellular signaling domain-containing protein [Sphingobacterium sp. UBA6320]
MMLFRLLLFLLIVPIPAFSQIKLADHIEYVTPDSNLDILKLEREVQPQEIKALLHEFTPSNAANPNLGISKFSVWVSFSIQNLSKRSHYLLDVAYPLLDDVELYDLDDTGNLRSLGHLGSFKAFKHRTYQSTNYIFDLHLKSSETKQYFLRVKSSEQIILPIAVGKPDVVWERLWKENILLGLFLGVVLIMAIYNFFLFLSVRDSAYLYYVLYISFLGLTQLGIVGFNFQFLWPNNPEWESISVVLFACLSSIAVLFFSNQFLNLRTNAPIIRKVLFVLLGLFLLSMLFMVFGYRQLAFELMQITTSLETVALFIASLYVLKKNYLPARYFFIAWSILLIGALIFLLKDYGILPYNLFTSNSFRLASIIEMALLSFALASRINILKKEKEMSQAKELATSLENERLIREQNVVLEQKVEERTSELMEANESLQATLTHLKETQSQLVEAEKMASLGQLTAGVAHEINNPINFVTSNVAPLKRDISMIWDTLEEVEHLAFNEELSLNEKKSRIEAYKEEIDLEYLKTEVDFLLKGMSDGANRTAEIVKSLRIFSRVDEDTLKFADINEGLESTMVILNSLIQQGIEVEKNYGDLPAIECYAGKLNQVFLNILTNAIYAINKKFVNKPGGTLKLDTGIDEDDSFIFIRIQDNGIGIPANIRDKIFEPFFTTKDVGEGTGLGMSIAYNTIAKHNGKIVVDSVIGEGTSFKLIIPIRQIN